MKVGLVNCGTGGNVASVSSALRAAGANVTELARPEDFNLVDKIVLPGVGGFNDCMSSLKKSGLDAAIKNFSGEILGICLGMQILGYVGFEHGVTKGLDLIDGEVKPMICEGKVPHVGFNKLEVLGDLPILHGISNEWFYFMHSYELVNYTDIIALTEYEHHKFVSAVQSRNCVGVQFHPEKSGDAGIQLFKNFIDN